MSHCGQPSACHEQSRERGCACGERVRAEVESAPQTHVAAPVSDSGGRVGSGAIRRLLGRENGTGRIR